MTIYYHIDPFDKIITTNPSYLERNKSTEIEFNLTNLIIKSSRQNFDKLSAPFLVLPALIKPVTACKVGTLDSVDRRRTRISTLME